MTNWFQKQDRRGCPERPNGLSLKKKFVPLVDKDFGDKCAKRDFS